MANIVETIAGDRRLQLGNEEFLRQMSFSSDWKKLRLGVRVAFNGNATITTVQFQIGFSQGTANGYKSNSTTDYIGYRPQSVGGWSYNAGPPAYYSGIMNFFVVTRKGSTDTSQASNSANGFVSAAPATNRSAFYVEVAKGNQPTIAGFYPNSSANAQIDCSLNNFFRLLEAETIGTEYVSNTNTFTMAYNGAQAWDSVSIYWNNASPTVEISDVAVCRFE